MHFSWGYFFYCFLEVLLYFTHLSYCDSVFDIAWYLLMLELYLGRYLFTLIKSTLVVSFYVIYDLNVQVYCIGLQMRFYMHVYVCVKLIEAFVWWERGNLKNICLVGFFTNHCIWSAVMVYMLSFDINLVEFKFRDMVL